MISIRFRIDIGPGASIGPGKIDLLEQIRKTGSLSEAARVLGMSYRRAWLILDDLNRAFRKPAARTSVGGKGGGGAQLTDLGVQIIDRYRELESAVGREVTRRFRDLVPIVSPPATAREAKPAITAKTVRSRASASAPASKRSSRAPRSSPRE